MNETMNGDTKQGTLSTADLVAATRVTNPPEAHLAPLFSDGTAGTFRARWSIVQQGFVDDQKKAVREGDELVAQVIKSLAETFAEQRAALEGDQSSTEALRLALRRYRSFFERLLAI
jgi:hypothetical protein